MHAAVIIEWEKNIHKFEWQSISWLNSKINSKENLCSSDSVKFTIILSLSQALNKLNIPPFELLSRLKIYHIPTLFLFEVAPYSFVTASALMMCAVVICARSHEIVRFPDIL